MLLMLHAKSISAVFGCASGSAVPARGGGWTNGVQCRASGRTTANCSQEVCNSLVGARVTTTEWRGWLWCGHPGIHRVCNTVSCVVEAKSSHVTDEENMTVVAEDDIYTNGSSY